MAASYNYDAHQSCHGMSRLDAVKAYIATLEKFLSDPDVVCSDCNLKDTSELRYGYRCSCPGGYESE